MPKQSYNKPALNIDEKIELLQSRWLIFNDIEEEKHYLEHIGYFRLTWYFKFFQDKETNIFHEWITFKQIVDLYVFDRKLRLLTLDSVEKIEVSLKANINDFLAKEFWYHWYLNEELFYLKYDWQKNIYNKLILKIKEKQNKSSAIFIKEYFKKYDENYLPSWMLFEELTVWEVTNIYKILWRKYQKVISNKYEIYFKDFSNWLQLITVIRNISAHHSRLWNKEYIIKLSSKDKIYWNIFTKNEYGVISNYHNTALIINHLLKKINRNFSWLDDLEKLFLEFDNIDISKMWFNEDWREKFEQ